MSKFPKLPLLVALVMLGTLSTSPASAAEWHSNGLLAFSSTSAGASRLVVHDAGTPIVTIACSGSSVSGTLNGPTRATTVWVGAATATPAFSTCSLSGSPGFSFSCSTGELAAIGYAGGTTLATAGGGLTTGTLAAIDCRVSIGATTCSTITGSATAHYINPSPIGSGSGRLTLTAAGQLLQAQKMGAGCALLPNGTATIGAPGTGTSVSDLSYTVDGPGAPYLYRTP